MLAKVILADDHNVMREALRHLLEKNQSLKVVGEASSGIEAVKLCGQLCPDLVIMDVTMPDLNGVEATRRIKKESSGVRVLGLSMHSGRQYVIGMIKAGASAYLMKDCSFQELNSAISAVLAGGSYISPQAAEMVMHELQSGEEQSGTPEIERLTSREREILQMVAEAKRSKEIADRLCISAKTVYTHRRNIMEKLGAKNVADLTRFAIENGIIPMNT